MPKISNTTKVANALRSALTENQLEKLKANVEAKAPVMTEAARGEYFDGTRASVPVLANTTKMPKTRISSLAPFADVRDGRAMRPNRLHVSTETKLLEVEPEFRQALAAIGEKGFRKAVTQAVSNG